MAEILHHLRCMKPQQNGINRLSAGAGGLNHQQYYSSFFKALKQGNADGRGDDRTVEVGSFHQNSGHCNWIWTQIVKEQKPKGFYYNKEKGRWMEHGKEDLKKLLVGRLGSTYCYVELAFRF